MSISPVQLTTSRIGNLTRLIHTLLYVMTIHTYTYIHTHTQTRFQLYLGVQPGMRDVYRRVLGFRNRLVAARTLGPPFRVQKTSKRNRTGDIINRSIENRCRRLEAEEGGGGRDDKDSVALSMVTV